MPNKKWICTIFLVVRINSPRKVQDNESMLKRYCKDTDFCIVFFIQIGSAGVPYTTVKAFLIQIRGDICKEKLTPRYQRYKESPTLRITITESGQSPTLWNDVSLTPRFTDTGIHFPILFLKNSLYRWYGEVLTLCIGDTMSRWLAVLVIWGVGDSPYHW